MEKILQKALRLERLSTAEVNVLINTTEPEQVEKIFDTALKVKREIYGNRIVFFTPLYISNRCSNNCLYCSFKSSNSVVRTSLTQQQIAQETEAILKQGHKRILMVAGEDHSKSYMDYIMDSISSIYSARYKNNNIRRVNVNIAPLDIDGFKRLKTSNIGTFQLFQETYHRETYKIMHPSGPKSDYDYRYSAIGRAIQAGIDDVGIGVLFGLYDWKYEIIALLEHIEFLEKTYGLGPHTISVPRIEPAVGSDLASHPPYRVTDEDFKKIVAILRLAVPYTGLIISTRETEEMRRSILQLGASQMSAGSRTNPGGYSEEQSEEHNISQFTLGDHRNLDEVIKDLLQNNFLPSFCTACYRLGRTGLDFMETAKPGDIKLRCQPNGLVTFKEYLEDFASPEVKKLGEAKIQEWLQEMDNKTCKDAVTEKLHRVEKGKRDIYE